MLTSKAFFKSTALAITVLLAAMIQPGPGEIRADVIEADVDPDHRKLSPENPDFTKRNEGDIERQEALLDNVSQDGTGASEGDGGYVVSYDNGLTAAVHFADGGTLTFTYAESESPDSPPAVEITGPDVQLNIGGEDSTPPPAKNAPSVLLITDERTRANFVDALKEPEDKTRPALNFEELRKALHRYRENLDRALDRYAGETAPYYEKMAARFESALNPAFFESDPKDNEEDDAAVGTGLRKKIDLFIRGLIDGMPPHDSITGEMRSELLALHEELAASCLAPAQATLSESIRTAAWEFGETVRSLTSNGNTTIERSGGVVEVLIVLP